MHLSNPFETKGGSVEEPIKIVGGGLCGLSLGIALLRGGRRVSLYEAATYPRHRVCGEFINGVTEETLDRLGILDLFEDAHRHRSLSWGTSRGSFYETELEKPALGISRYVLDERMRERFMSLGGALHFQRVGRDELTAEPGWIWTAGRLPAKDSPWVGMKAHIKGLEMDQDLQMWMGKKSYVGLCPVEGGRVNVCGLFQKTAVRDAESDPAITDPKLGKLVTLLRGMTPPAMAERFRQADWDPDSFSTVAAFQLGDQFGGKEAFSTAESAPDAYSALFLGDAERMIPPFTGNGMSMAFEAADLAADVILSRGAREANPGESWTAQCEAVTARLQEKFSRRMRLSLFLHPFLLHPTGQVMIRSLVASGFFPFHRFAEALRT